MFQKSELMLCFIDRTKAPKGTMANVYRDARGKSSGVFVVPYKDFLIADKSTMPVDLLKLLESKDLMKEHIDMAGFINIGERKSPLAVAEVVQKFKPMFE